MAKPIIDGYLQLRGRERRKAEEEEGEFRPEEACEVKEERELTLAIFESIAGQIGRNEPLLVADDLLLRVRPLLLLLDSAGAEVAVFTC